MRTEESIRFRLRPRLSTGRSIATLLFAIWGVFGLLVASLADLFRPGSIGVGTSAFIAALATLWIGGMVFFGFCALVGGVSYDMIETQDPRND